MNRFESLLVLLSFAVNLSAGTLADTVAEVKPSVVGVGVVSLPGNDNPSLLASGFVVSSGTHAVTTLSAIEGRSGDSSREALGVFLPVSGDRAQFRAVSIVARDAEHDLCVMRFPGSALPAMRLGRAGDVREGGLYAFTGFPKAGTVGLHPITHRALVAAISPNILPLASGAELGRDVLRKLTRPFAVFQLDATPYAGNSGSPLYEADTGRVVGVVNSVFVKQTKEIGSTSASAISYAIPVSHVRKLLSRAGLSN
jgi:hypothetical protein